MTSTAIPAPPRDAASGDGYIRGAGARPVSRRRVVRTGFALCLTILLALAAVLAIQAKRENSRRDRLQASGVAVRVTLTSCVGLASGTGITVAGYDCQGTFTLRGRRYTELINGSLPAHVAGAVVAAVADPNDPANVSAAASAGAVAVSSWQAYLSSLIVAGLALILILAALVRYEPKSSVSQSRPCSVSI